MLHRSQYGVLPVQGINNNTVQGGRSKTSGSTDRTFAIDPAQRLDAEAAAAQACAGLGPAAADTRTAYGASNKVAVTHDPVMVSDKLPAFWPAPLRQQSTSVPGNVMAKRPIAQIPTKTGQECRTVSHCAAVHPVEQVAAHHEFCVLVPAHIVHYSGNCSLRRATAVSHKIGQEHPIRQAITKDSDC